jgi:hypothetical protein
LGRGKWDRLEIAVQLPHEMKLRKLSAKKKKAVKKKAVSLKQ